MKNQNELEGVISRIGDSICKCGGIFNPMCDLSKPENLNQGETVCSCGDFRPSNPNEGS